MPKPKKNRVKLITDIISPKMMDWYMDHPDDFVEDVIFGKKAKINGGKYFVTDQQREILYSVCNNKQTSVRAGRGIGKSGCLSWIILWWMCMFSQPKIIATAPSFPQLQSVLWPEVNKWLQMSTVRQCFQWGRKRMYLVADPANSFAEPRTASKEEAMQGLHADNLLILVDEAAGVEDNIWDTIEAGLTGANNKVCLMANPARVSGFFYDSHNSNKDIWKTLAYSSENSPIVDKKMLDDMKFKFVRENFIHDMYKIHILGEFPTGDPNAFFSMDDILKSIANTKTTRTGDVELGVDVARKGDDLTVICVRQGGFVFSAQELGLVEDKGEPILYSGGKTKMPEVVDMVKKAIAAVRNVTGFQGTIRVKVDDTGIGGAVTDYLELICDELNIEVIPCNFGGSGKDYKYDANEATHMWANLENILDDVRLPHDRFLVEELVARRWDPDGHGKRLIESKTKFKKDFKGSPDRADALVLCFADAERAKLYASSFQNSQSNLVEVEGMRIASLGKRYLSVYCSPKGELTAIGASYDEGRLGVFLHNTGPINSIAESVSMFSRHTQVVGSKSMFGEGQNMATKFMLNGIPIIRAFNFDEASAIYELDKLMQAGKLVLASECADLKRQLKSWEKDSSRSELFETHGGCYGLLHVVSELKSEQMCQLTGMSF